jgi:hypothetical protein
MGLGRLELSYILEVGGSGYFRLQAVRPYLKTLLHLVRGAPEILYPAYLVYSASTEASLIETAMTGLREAAQMKRLRPRGQKLRHGAAR